MLDTNVLVGAAYAAESASRRILDACLAGEVTVILSPALEKEWRFILDRAVRVHGYDTSLRQLLEQAERVEPETTPRVVPADPEDDKLIATALAGHADALITNDRHLLELDPYESVRILRPAEFVCLHLEH